MYIYDVPPKFVLFPYDPSNFSIIPFSAQKGKVDSMEDEDISKPRTTLPSSTTNDDEDDRSRAERKKGSASSDSEATLKTRHGNAIKVEKRY